METFVQGIQNLQLRQNIRDDDTVDQFHHFVTVYLLAFAGFLIGLKEFVGEPLDCWVNLETWKHYQSHVNSYCWAHNLYAFPNTSNLSQVPYPIEPGLSGPTDDDVSTHDLGEINFYRWVTVIFFIQAFMFKVPSLVWKEINNYSGTNLEKMVSMLTGSSFVMKEERTKMFEAMAEFLETWLKINRKPFRFMNTGIGKAARKILRYCMLCVGANTGNYLSSVYLVVKFLYLFNLLMQFVILTAFLEFNFWDYGPHALSNLPSDQLSDRFPRTGLCHFQLQGEGHWIQCILSINMLLENIFLIQWFWFIVLLILTTLSFLGWLSKTLQTQSSVRFISKYLANHINDGRVAKESSRTVNSIVVDYLGNDGIFLLRILATNTNDVVMAQLMECVWDRYTRYDAQDWNKVKVTLPARHEQSGDKHLIFKGSDENDAKQ